MIVWRREGEGEFHESGTGKGGGKKRTPCSLGMLLRLRRGKKKGGSRWRSEGKCTEDGQTSPGEGRGGGARMYYLCIYGILPLEKKGETG